MKDFDIEKLERENVFKMPDGFFEDMQNKVLQETVPVKQGKIIKLNWAYGAAAAVALLVGVSVMKNQDPAVETQSMTTIVPADVNPATYTLSDINPKEEDAIALKVLESDLSSVEEVHPKVNAKSKAVSTNGTSSFTSQRGQTSNPNPEGQVDQILASFTSAELAVVGKNTEQDVYLDLYN